MSEKPGFMVYHELSKALEQLTDDQAGRIFKAMIRYSESGEVPDFENEPMLKFAWSFVYSSLNRDAERYDAIKLKKSYAAYVRWSKERGEIPVTFEDWMQMDADVCTCIDVHSGALQTMPTTTPAPSPTPTPAPTATTTPSPASTPTSISAEKTFEEDIGKGVQGENLQGETLEEKSETPYRPSPADEFRARHAGSGVDHEFVSYCYGLMRDREQAKAAQF